MKLSGWLLVSCLVVFPLASVRAAELDVGAMAQLPDDAARRAVTAFADAVEKEDATAMAALLPAKGIKLLGKKKTRKQLQTLLDKKGVVGLVGTLPRGLVMGKEDKENGVGYNWTVELDKKGRVVIYGVPYGVVREAVLARDGDTWKLVELRNANHGAP
jgi:hypothetical protein